MVLAGAGSGKTRVLVHRIAHLVRGGVYPERILAVTFTNKAAGEMRARLHEELGGGAGTMWIGTFHATCARLLRLYHEAAELSQDFTIFDGDDQMKLIGKLIKQENLADAVTPRNVLSAIDRAKNRGVDPMSMDRGQYLDDIVRQIYPLYQEQLKKEDAADFNDLLLKVLALKEHEVVGPELAERFEYVLVDEFQDTNLIQYRLVQLFSAKTKNLTVVGDDDQSIYAWRGAEPRNLLDFDRDHPDAAVVKLEQNYRSTELILEASNAIISENDDRHDKKLWTERSGGEPILWEEADDERSEADFIARGIRGLEEQEGRTWGDVAVLYRTHSQSRVLEEMFRMYRIDYRIVGGVSFFQRKEVKDIRAYLRLICNPAADTCFDRVVNVPTRGIGKTTVERLRQYAIRQGLSMMVAARHCAQGEVKEIKAAARKKVSSFVALLDGLIELQARQPSVAEMIIQTVERSGYREKLEEEDTHESRERLGNLSELVTMASDFDEETDGKGTLTEFEERNSLDSANDKPDGRGEAVTLMTIHASKGLEFPVVFVCGMEDGLFPSIREGTLAEEREKLEEERRLCYVAFTRAMDRLVLTNARLRRQWGEARMNRHSRFIDALPGECLAVREQVVPERRARNETPNRLRRETKEPEYDFDQRTGYDELEFPPPEEVVGGAIPAGARVNHASFGSGKVLETRGSGKDLKLLVQFSSVGLKTVLANYVQRV